jgi:cytochrome b pre-mRNA-processing protein 3
MRRSQGGCGQVSANWVNLMILQLFRPSSPAPNIRDLYGAIVAQARKPAFYSGYGVPDTLEGRFDLIVLHLVLVLSQTSPLAGQDGRQNGRQADGTASAIGQKLFDAFCQDLDHNLREMGVGDLAVPKRMRGFAEAFYGRQAAYLAALAAPDQRELENALARNIFGVTKAGEGSPQLGAVRLAAYVRAVLSQFKVQRHGALDAALWRGQVVFPEPETVSPQTIRAVPNEAIQNG